ncbi:unnamed protein product [Parascedosporium putredinis]|uniref:Actin-like protein n=1 Tax=Parascedosporium putredinis TaxID=1442378 RepID=A0A9P1H0P8_9PEZI|nr:unnamed protein product [Parascedosporium putredinis]CAI7991995.1 unnamed protein product [Parascedosporium putredinis]
MSFRRLTMSFHRLTVTFHRTRRIFLVPLHRLDLDLSYVSITAQRIPLKLSDIFVVQDWGGGESIPKVPSLFTYDPQGGGCWGHNIRENSVIIRWTKLELEVPRDTSDGNVPEHLIKSSPQIMTAYLTEVAKAVRADIEAKRSAATELLARFPIDLVITHPAEWDQRAKNTTFRAVNEAFRNYGAFPSLRTTPGSVYLVTEPEACAQYTAVTASEQGVGSENVGATVIDRNFLDLVKQRLSSENYQKLMTLGNGPRDMEDLFKTSVDRTIELTEQQLVQVDSWTRRPASAIFLSGGFSRNEYLFQKLNEMARNKRLLLFRGSDERNDSWTAVCMGGVIMGLGMECSPLRPANK